MTETAPLRLAIVGLGTVGAGVIRLLQVNGDIAEAPVSEPGPLLGSVEQVAADLGHAARLGVAHVCWHSDGDSLRQVQFVGQLRRG